MDRLKPHLGSSPLQAARPPKRGRPPASLQPRELKAEDDLPGSGGRGPPLGGVVWRTGNPPSYIVVCTQNLYDIKSAKFYEIYAS
jgi:hypothetical protein